MIKFDDEIHGLAHISELSDNPNVDYKEVKEKFLFGSKHNFEIITIDPSEHRLGLKLEGVKGRKTMKTEKKDKEEKIVKEKMVKNEEKKE